MRLEHKVVSLKYSTDEASLLISSDGFNGQNTLQLPVTLLQRSAISKQHKTFILILHPWALKFYLIFGSALLFSLHFKGEDMLYITLSLGSPQHHTKHHEQVCHTCTVLWTPGTPLHVLTNWHCINRPLYGAGLHRPLFNK